MFQLVYASTATRAFTDGELFDMLGQFRERNTRLGITGLLLYKEGAFMQALEGDEATVCSLYDVIRGDERHRNVATLLAIPVPQRQFPDWSMGFRHLETDDVFSSEGYKTLPEVFPPVDSLPWKASVALKLLATFNEQE
jgi:hypothetical protein